MWLAQTGVDLRSSIEDVLDVRADGYPLLKDHAIRITLPPRRKEKLLRQAREIVESLGADVRTAPWYSDDWVERVLEEAPHAFDRAFDRWRFMYASALQEHDRAHSERLYARNREARENAERRLQAALRELDLLLNRTERGSAWEGVESDFYPYRYLASEGFLPGYNFPRLPLRVLLRVGQETHAISRPRFLGLEEFGPGNVFYHEGRKYRVRQVVLPGAGIDSLLTEAMLCFRCGFFHERRLAERCENCGGEMTGDVSEYVSELLETPVSRAVIAGRITSNEEVRSKEGYNLEVYFRFAGRPDGDFLKEQAVAVSGGSALLELTYGPQATLWLINNGWKRSRSRQGFVIERDTGWWESRPEEAQSFRTGYGPAKSTVRPYARDTRNVLLLRPVVTADGGSAPTDGFLASLAYALVHAIQVLYQVEPDEIKIDLVGRESLRQILLWEAAEGGIGVWSRLLDEPGALARVARKALEMCHFDPDTGEDLMPQCVRACYRCLLSYRNQPNHRLLDRYAVRRFLLGLARAETLRVREELDYDEQYRRLIEQVDPASSLERRFLERLYATRRHLPDLVHYRPEQDVYAEADFYYERKGLKGVCVFCDGPYHDDPVQRRHDEEEREKLKDMGYRVIVIRYDDDLDEQIKRHADVFGQGTVCGAASSSQAT